MTASKADAWQLADIPDQAGRTVVVTGTTLGGLGHHTALELARRGARVVLAGRSPERLGETRETIRAEVPAAELEQLEVDLADLGSVRRAGEAATAFGPIDVLVNNAGVMGTSRQVTADGLDLQLATNHFGPFLLTGLLLPQLVASKDATVVTVSSNMHRVARGAPLGDPRVHHGLYAKWRVYGQTKLANLLFTYELDRRARAKELPVQGAGRAPGLRGHPPGRQRAVRPLRRRHRHDPRRQRQGGLAVGRAGRLAAADGRHRGPARARRTSARAVSARWAGAPQVVDVDPALARPRTRSAACGSSARRRRGSATPDLRPRQARLSTPDHPLEHHPGRLVVGSELLLEPFLEVLR